MTTRMTPAHLATYETIFRHPIARNLEWRDVRALLESVCDAAEPHGAHVKFTRNGQTLRVTPPRRKDFSDVRAIMDVRHFLERSDDPEPDRVAAAAATGTAEDGLDLLVVIDHRAARIYGTETHGSVPQRVVAFDDGGAGRHLHYVDDDSNGQRRPERRSFYDAVAKAVERGRRIVIFGSGTGASSAMDELVRQLREHHRDLARRVVATLVVNEQHMTEDQLLAEARGVYDRLASSPPPSLPNEREAAD